ncbi:MAG: hypothetical protein NTX49_07395 [Chlamydiae bacterium]|nr:hypothetical protein [Chlamydiota bacterium]
MAAPMQPVNEAMPVAQGIQTRGASRSLVLCGRSVTNCCAHTAFIAGYGLAFTGLGVSIWYQSIVVGVFSAIVAVPIGVSQCFWSRYSNVANAAEDVDDAARGAREAAAIVQTAATAILQSSGNIARAAGHTEQAAGHIQVVVDGERLASLEVNAREFTESSEVISRENALLKEQLEDLKGCLSPLMALVTSFKSSLSTLKVGIQAGTPLLVSFTDLERRLDFVASSLQSDAQSTASSIQSLIEEAAQIAIATMQIIQQKNRDLSQELRAATSSLVSTVAQTAGLTEHIAQQEAERNTLIARLEAMQRENRTLQERLQQTLGAIDTQRRGHEDSAAAGIGESTQSLRDVAGERERLIELIALMQELKRSLPTPSAAGVT